MRWFFRLPEGVWYRYDDNYWTIDEGASYELLNEISREVDKVKGRFTPSLERKGGKGVNPTFVLSLRPSGVL